MTAQCLNAASAVMIFDAWVVLVMVQVGVDVTVVVSVLVMSARLESIGFMVRETNSAMDALWKGAKRIIPWLTEPLPVGSLRLSRGPGMRRM